MAHFSPRQVYPEKKAKKWARKEVAADAPEGMWLVKVGFCFGFGFGFPNAAEC